MYLNTVARYLGDAKRITMPIPRGIPRPTPPKRPKPCVPRTVCQPDGLCYVIDCSTPTWPPVLHGLGTITACKDAGSGLLIDCWRAAEQKGLGEALDQAQLSKVATAYQRIMRPDSLAGLGRWVFTGRGMVWQGGMGDARDFQTLDRMKAIVSAPPDPLKVLKPSPPTFVIDTIKNTAPVLPAVSAQTLLQAAQLPNAPDAVKQAAAQIPQQASVFGGIGDWLTGEMVSGIPNYALVGAGLVVLMLLGSWRGRRY